MRAEKHETPVGKAPQSVKRKADVTRGAIVVTAARMFAEKGYSECNLREIAAKVGIQAGSFYYHFRSKEQLLDEILDESISLINSEVVGAIGRLAADAAVPDKIAAAIRAHVRTFLRADRSSAALMRVYEHLPPAMKRRSRERRRAYALVWYDLFEEGVRRGEIRDDVDLKLMVPFILAGMSRVIEWYNPRVMRLEQVCELAVELYLRGGALPNNRGKGSP